MIRRTFPVASRARKNDVFMTGINDRTIPQRSSTVSSYQVLFEPATGSLDRKRFIIAFHQALSIVRMSSPLAEIQRRYPDEGDDGVSPKR